MRARLPAFDGLQGGEIAMLGLPVLQALHAQGISLSLAEVILQLDEMGVSAVAVGGVGPDELLSMEEQQMLAEAISLAEANGMPLLALPSATLNEMGRIADPGSRAAWGRSYSAAPCERAGGHTGFLGTSSRDAGSGAGASGWYGTWSGRPGRTSEWAAGPRSG
jgi:hypothetical protein